MNQVLQFVRQFANSPLAILGNMRSIIVELRGISTDLRELLSLLRARDEKAQYRIVAVQWYRKAVGESAWEYDCIWDTVRVGCSTTIELHAYGKRIEANSTIVVLGGFASRILNGNIIEGAGQTVSLRNTVEHGQTIRVDVIPL